MNSLKKILIPIFMTIAFNKLLCPPPEPAPVTPPRRKRVCFDGSRLDAPARDQSKGNPRLITYELYPKEATPGRPAGAEVNPCKKCEKPTSSADYICWGCTASDSRISDDYRQYCELKDLQERYCRDLNFLQTWLANPANNAHPANAKIKFYATVISKYLNLSSACMELKKGNNALKQQATYAKFSNITYNKETEHITFNYNRSSGETEQKNMTLIDFIFDVLLHANHFFCLINTIIKA